MKTTFFSLILLTSIFTSYSSFGAEKTLENTYINGCDGGSNEHRIPDTNPHNLSIGERLVIVNYTIGDYIDINSKLRLKDKLETCEEIFITLLDQALLKIPNYKGVVYRGTIQEYVTLKKNEAYPTAPLLSYTSTSVDLEVAQNFLIDRLEILNVKTGKDISAYSAAYHEGVNEREVLLPRGTRLFVDNLILKKQNFEVFDSGDFYNEERLVETVHASEI